MQRIVLDLLSSVLREFIVSDLVSVVTSYIVLRCDQCREMVSLAVWMCQVVLIVGGGQNVLGLPLGIGSIQGIPERDLLGAVGSRIDQQMQDGAAPRNGAEWLGEPA